MDTQFYSAFSGLSPAVTPGLGLQGFVPTFSL